MKKQFALAGVALLAMTSLCFGQAGMTNAAKSKGKSLSPSEQQNKAIIDKEVALWEMVKNKQVDAFRPYHADKFSAVLSDGVINLNQQIEGIRDLDLKSYSLTDTKVVFPSKDIALLTYKVTVQGSYKGQDISGAYYASTVWVNQGGKWLAFLYTEIKAT